MTPYVVKFKNKLLHVLVLHAEILLMPFEVLGKGLSNLVEGFLPHVHSKVYNKSSFLFKQSGCGHERQRQWQGEVPNAMKSYEGVEALRDMTF